MMKNLKYKHFWLTLGLGLIALVVYLSLAPQITLPATPIRAIDKWGHFSAYALLVFWFLQLCRSRHFRQLLLGFILMGLTLEILQNFTEKRTFEYLDLFANSLGAVVSFFIFRTRDSFFVWVEGRTGVSCK